MHWKCIDADGFVAAAKNLLDQMIKANALVISKVEDVVTVTTGESSNDTIYDVIDICEISFSRSVPVHRYRFPLIDQ